MQHNNTTTRTGTLWGGASSKCVQETVDASDLQLFVGVWLTDCTTVGFSTLMKVGRAWREWTAIGRCPYHTLLPITQNG